MSKKILLGVIILLLPLVLGFGRLIDPITEEEVERWINNSNFDWGDNNISANYGFFDYLGSSLSPITIGYFSQIEVGT
ncbi:unnamed protein product, partial [marine sediment metagenome]